VTKHYRINKHLKSWERKHPVIWVSASCRWWIRWTPKLE